MDRREPARIILISTKQSTILRRLFRPARVEPTGSRNKERIVENLDASNVALTDEEFSALEESLNQCRVYGHRGLGGF